MPSLSTLSARVERSLPPPLRSVFRPLLFALVLIAGTTWFIAELADGVAENDTQAFDERVLLALRNPSDTTDPLGPQWLEEVGRDITALGSVALITLTTLGATVYLVLRRKTRTALLFAVAVIGGDALSLFLKALFARPRPSLVPHATQVYTHSFPSGHSLMAAVTYLTLGILLARVHRGHWVKSFLISAAVLLTLLIGLSRLYLGVHYPTDVLAGWTVGGAWALVCLAVAKMLERRHLIEPEASPAPEPESPITR